MILYFTEKEKLPLSGEIDNLMAHVMKNFMALSSGTVWSRSQQTVSRPTMFDYAYHFWFILECFSLLAICSTRPTVQLFRNFGGIGLTAQAMFSHYCRIALTRVAKKMDYARQPHLGHILTLESRGINLTQTMRTESGRSLQRTQATASRRPNSKQAETT